MPITLYAISVQQPWAWLIVNGFKDVENRTWRLPDKHRGPVLIHASLKPRFSLAAARELLETFHARYGLAGGLRFPREGREVGGVVGVATLTGCTSDHVSPWCAGGQWHWRIEAARPLPFMPCRGQLGFFRVDYVAPASRGSLVEGVAF
uniref:ASCH domain-containing protein n=1 Tax=Desulfovibrio sp. U5L TaxID=596152 RepID=I2Q2Q5_9BACT